LSHFGTTKKYKCKEHYVHIPILGSYDMLVTFGALISNFFLGGGFLDNISACTAAFTLFFRTREVWLLNQNLWSDTKCSDTWWFRGDWYSAKFLQWRKTVKKFPSIRLSYNSLGKALDELASINWFFLWRRWNITCKIIYDVLDHL
jgi:hypothetical protein